MLAVHPDLETLTIRDLAAILHCAEKTIRNALSSTSRHHSVPKPLERYGSRRLLWRKKDVIVWLAARAHPEQQKPRRGRPTKAETRARRAAA